MNIPKLFCIVALLLFGVIGLSALFKKGSSPTEEVVVVNSAPVEIELEKELRSISENDNNKNNNTQVVQTTPAEQTLPNRKDTNLPTANRIDELFRKVEPKLPFVETISYKSRTPWLEGRPAWISDYASHYKTSRHFIARSLNGKPDYFKQDVAIGDRFNVFRLDKDISFYLVIDLSRSKMWFYYYDRGADERGLLKTYDVGLGRVDGSQPSGLLTPLGKYALGEKIGIYKPGKMGLFNGEKTEMIRVFGTRWIPFDKEIACCTAPAKGLGIHGVPWIQNSNGDLVEERLCIGKYESDGCIRLVKDDVEELFSIIITKPTYVELVKDFYDAKLPGKEKNPS